MTTLPPTGKRSFATLRGFVRPKTPVERCALCGQALAPEHKHLWERANRRLVCSCGACALLFEGREGSRYLPIPGTRWFLLDCRMTDAQWDSLLIPIDMAFILHDSAAGKMVAYYPSPAGATESLLRLETWQELVAENPVLGALQPDVEAFLVNRVRGAREYYRVPIDACYQLVGLIRAHWRGLSGGTVVWEEIGRFFARLKEQACPT